jgi:hypothetical protein
MVPMLMLYHEHDPDPEMRPAERVNDFETHDGGI